MQLLNIRKLTFWQVKPLFRTPLISVFRCFCFWVFLHFLFIYFFIGFPSTQTFRKRSIFACQFILFDSHGVEWRNSTPCLADNPLRLHLWLVFCFGQAMVRSVWAVLRSVSSAGKAARISNVPGRCASVFLRPTSPVVATCRSLLSR